LSRGVRPAELASGAQGEVMEAAGLALWTAMAAIVDGSPHYTNATGPERSACIGRLALQAFAAAVIDQAPGASAQTYIIVSACARLIGNVMAQSPARAAAVAELLAAETQIGAEDFERVTTPQGSA
jgi:hypothetical protein